MTTLRQIAMLIASYESGRMLTIVGGVMVMVGIIGAAGWCILAKPKPGTPRSNILATRLLGLALLLLAAYVGYQMWPL